MSVLNHHDLTTVVDETTLATPAAYDRVRGAVSDHQSTTLYDSDRKVLLAALDAPPEPTVALRQAMTLHAARIARPR